MIDVEKRNHLLYFVILCSLLMGCASGRALPDDEVFKKAINNYLQDRAMDMRILRLIKRNIERDNAYVIAELQDQDGLYQIKVKWRFILKKDQEWSVLRHERS